VAIGSVDNFFGAIGGSGLLGLARVPDHVLEEHVVGGREADAGAQDIFDAGALLEERVDHRSTLRHLRRLAQVRQDGEHGAQRPVLGHDALLDARHRDPAAQLGDQRQVQDKGRRQQRVLAGVVHHDRVVPAQHDLGRVLVHRAFAVAWETDRAKCLSQL